MPLGAAPNLLDMYDPQTGELVGAQVPQAPDLLDLYDPQTGEKAASLAGLVKAGGTGVVRGSQNIAGMVGDIKNLVGEGVLRVGDKLGLPRPPSGPGSQPSITSLVTGQQPERPKTDLQRLRETVEAPTSAQVDAAREKLTGKLYEPQNRAERFAETMGEFVPGAALTPGGTLSTNLVRWGLVPGAASEAAGQLAEGSGHEGLARTVAALASPFAAKKIITPFPADPTRLPALQHLRDEGVTGMSPGQITGSTPLRYTESVLADLPGTGRSAEALNVRNAEQLTEASLRRIGIQGETRARPEVMQAAHDGIGAEFDRLTAAHAMPLDQQLQNRMLTHVIEYHSDVNPMMRAPVVEEVMNDAAQWAGQQGGQLNGRQYQNLRSRLGRASAGTNDPQLSRALANLRNDLDDAMERAIQVTTPEDVGAFGHVRNQYRDYLMLERALAGHGPQAAGGLVTPGRLHAAAQSVAGTRDYVLGHTQLGNLARSAEEILTPLPQSGTGPRENIWHQLQLAGILAGGGGVEHGATGTMVGALAGLLGPPLAGRAYFSGPGQRYLTNQIFPRVNLSDDAARQLYYARLLGQGAAGTLPGQGAPAALPPPR